MDNFDSRSSSKMSSTETFDFCTLYATIPRENLKTNHSQHILIFRLQAPFIAMGHGLT